MSEVLNAKVNDLLSTGYFYEELKNYIISTNSKEINLVLFNRDFAVPYLIRKSESYKKPEQINRARILNLAVRFLSDVNEEELAETIFALKKLAESEVDKNEKEFRTNDHPANAQSCRQRSESAQSLGKLLTSIIKMFRLAQIIRKQDNSPADKQDPIKDSIKIYWEELMLPSVKALPL